MRRWAVLVVAIVLLALALLRLDSTPSECVHPPRPEELLEGRVVEVVDADTVRAQVRGRDERVRLLGVDAPERTFNRRLKQQSRRWNRPPRELRRWGNTSYAWTRRHLAGQRVALELDAEKRDDFGRLLAYVWLDDRLFNLELVRQGYAWVYVVPPNVRYADLLEACQLEARESGRGLWEP